MRIVDAQPGTVILRAAKVGADALPLGLLLGQQAPLHAATICKMALMTCRISRLRGRPGIPTSPPSKSSRRSTAYRQIRQRSITPPLTSSTLAVDTDLFHRLASDLRSTGRNPMHRCGKKDEGRWAVDDGGPESWLQVDGLVSQPFLARSGLHPAMTL